MSMASLFPLKLKQNRMSALAVWCHVIITLLVVMSVKIIFSFLGDSSFDAVCSLIALFSFCWHTKKAGLKQTPPPKKPWILCYWTLLLGSTAWASLHFRVRDSLSFFLIFTSVRSPPCFHAWKPWSRWFETEQKIRTYKIKYKIRKKK